MAAVNFYEGIKANPEKFKQLSCKGLLFAHYTCPQVERLAEQYTPLNIISYTFAGWKRLHKLDRYWDQEENVAIFARKGAYEFERMDNQDHCVMMFFIPDSYLQNFAQQYRAQLPVGHLKRTSPDPVIRLALNERARAFFHSMVSYFNEPPHEELLELKFKELLLNLVTHPENNQLVTVLNRMHDGQRPSLRDVMEDNYLYNLTLDDFAKIALRSLATFKREFREMFGTTPARWLLQKKLEAAHRLLHSTDKRIGEIAFECGFENNTHFSRVFKTRYGKSPTYFRKEEPLIPGLVQPGNA